MDEELGTTEPLPPAVRVVCAGHEDDCPCPDCADAFTWAAFEASVAAEMERLRAVAERPDLDAGREPATAGSDQAGLAVAGEPQPAPVDGAAPQQLGRIRAALTSLAEAAPLDGADDQGLLDAVETAMKVEAAARAVTLGYLARAHRRQATVSRHGVRTGSWLDGHLHALDRSPANSLVTHALRLQERFPTTAAALAHGDLSPAQAEAAVRALIHLPADLSDEAVEIAERFLLQEAAYCSPADLRRSGNTLAARVDPEAEDARLEEQLQRADRQAQANRSLSFWEDSITGGIGFHGMLPPVEGRLFQDLVHAIVHRPQAGEHGQEAGDDRTATQKRADGLLEILHIYKGTDQTVCRGGSRPRINVLVPAAFLTGSGTAHGTLFDGEALTDTRTRSLACDAVLSLIGINEHGVPITAGSVGRYFTDDVRQALAVRDKGCAFPGCSAPPAACDGHHILPWALHGPTTVDNGVLLCPYHHRLVEPRPTAPPGTRWEVRLDTRGLPEVLPPTWVDAHRRPRQHHRYRSGDRNRPGSPPGPDTDR